MEFRIGDVNYRTQPMDAFKQWHIMRRLGAALTGDIIEVANRVIELRRKAALSGENWMIELMGATDIIEMVPVIEPLIRSLGRMSDQDSNYVILSCMSVVSRQVPGGSAWAPLVASDGVSLMYSDIQMPDMIKIVGYVLRDNLQSFFGGLLSTAPTERMAGNGHASQGARIG